MKTGILKGSKKRAAKKAVRQVKVARAKVPARQYGKATEEQTASGGTRGYANVGEKKYPKYHAPKKSKVKTRTTLKR